MNKIHHGELGNKLSKDYDNSSRKCNIHGWHGSLYICKYYSRYLKNKLKKIHNKIKNKKIKINIIFS